MVESHWVTAGLGRRIRELRQARGWSQMELSDRSDLHGTYVTDIERGARNVSIINVGRIATAFDVSISELLKGVEPIEVPTEKRV
jgi:transcriptional regulator with XRE-family HTH domain